MVMKQELLVQLVIFFALVTMNVSPILYQSHQPEEGREEYMTSENKLSLADVLAENGSETETSLGTKPRSLISIYPNPTKSQIAIKISNFDQEGRYQIQLLELNGRLLKEQRVNKQVEQVDLSNLAKGSYLFLLRKNGEQIGQEMVVKQ